MLVLYLQNHWSFTFPSSSHLHEAWLFLSIISCCVYSSVSQSPGRGPVPGPGINYSGPREVLLEFVTLVF